MTLFFRLLFALAATIGFCDRAWSQCDAASDALVSKNIPKIFAVDSRFFAFDDAGKSFSRLDLFSSTPCIKNGLWPWNDGAEDGVPWKTSLLLRSDSAADSARVERVAGLLYDGAHWKTADSLVLPFGSSSKTLSHSAGLTAMAIWHDTLILGFGRLGLTYARLASDVSDSLFVNDTMVFSSLPTHADSTTNLLPACVWNQKCRADTVLVPDSGLDSILALSVDSSASDSIWLLVATKSGLRRGLLGGKNFPKVQGISDSDNVLNLVASPDHALLWAFTDTHFFLSRDHGRTFYLPPTIAGIQTTPALLKGYTTTPEAVTWGDTTFVNFNLPLQPGLVLFKQDSLQKVNPTNTEISDVLFDATDSLNLVGAEGSLTRPAIAYNTNGQAILAVGSTVKGIFYRRLDLAGKAFTNLNLYRKVQGSLNEVITFPTVFPWTTITGQVVSNVHVGYQLSKNGNVTITVFNHAMEKVRTLVRNAPRKGGIARSENTVEDQWDGTDASGRHVSAGVYYILVESDQGERGFGKTISIRGRK